MTCLTSISCCGGMVDKFNVCMYLRVCMLVCMYVCTVCMYVCVYHSLLTLSVSKICAFFFHGSAQFLLHSKCYESACNSKMSWLFNLPNPAWLCPCCDALNLTQTLHATLLLEAHSRRASHPHCGSRKPRKLSLVVHCMLCRSYKNVFNVLFIMDESKTWCPTGIDFGSSSFPPLH
jgi:hypothetical protein